MEKLIEIARSFGQKIQFKAYEPIEFFCSAKEECEEKDMESTAKKLIHFCKTMVAADIHVYLEAHPEVQYKEEIIDALTGENFTKPIQRSVEQNNYEKNTEYENN